MCIYIYIYAEIVHPGSDTWMMHHDSEAEVVAPSTVLTPIPSKPGEAFGALAPPSPPAPGAPEAGSGAAPKTMPTSDAVGGAARQRALDQTTANILAVAGGGVAAALEGDTSGLRRVVNDHRFELVFGALIILNTLVLFLDRQFEGERSKCIMAGHLAGSDMCTGAFEWETGTSFFEFADATFGAIFLVEVLLKIIALKIDFFTARVPHDETNETKMVWQTFNIFDLFIVVIWLVVQTKLVSFGTNPTLLRTNTYT